MAKEPLKKPVQFGEEINRSMSPVRRIWSIVMILAVLGLTYFIYPAFGVGDASIWVQDVLILVLLFVLVFLAAALFVWVLALIRKARGQ